MATVSATKAASTAVVGGGMGGSNCQVAYETYEIASALSITNTISMLFLPKCDVVWGFLQGDDIDTGTEALELDVGHLANTDYNGTDAADPDRFLDSGVITGDAVTNILPTYAAAANFWMPFHGLKDGAVTLDGYKTEVQIIMTAAAAAGGTGTLSVAFFYATGV